MRRASRAIIIGAALVAPSLSLAVGTAQAGVSPATNTITVTAGNVGGEDKTVTVPEVPAKADIEIAIDTTGSMGGAIDQAKSQATALVNTVHTDIPDANFSVVDFKDAVDGPAEYVVKAPNTNDAATVQAAIDTMTAGGGGDYPEAQNLVLSSAATDDPALWRAGTRKFVVLITDAPPHAAAVNGFPSCPTGSESSDPHGLRTDAVVAALNTAQRTLFAVTAAPDVEQCYTDIAAASFTGSAQQPLGGDLSTQIEGLVAAATATVSDVHLEVVGPNPDASWISFTPATAGPVTTPATLPFHVTVTVPADATAGDHVFDIVALADGADIGHQSLTVTVLLPNEPPVCSAAAATPASLWPPNHQLVPVTITGVSDPDVGDTVSVAVTGVTQDEPLLGLGSGDQSPDAVLGTDGAVQVRAERSGQSDGRVYTVSFTATDSHGATCSGAMTVGVPHDQRPGSVAIDSGQSTNSLG